MRREKPSTQSIEAAWIAKFKSFKNKKKEKKKRKCVRNEIGSSIPAHHPHPSLWRPRRRRTTSPAEHLRHRAQYRSICLFIVVEFKKGHGFDGVVRRQMEGAWWAAMQTRRQGVHG